MQVSLSDLKLARERWIPEALGLTWRIHVEVTDHDRLTA
jgi:hypothetical protein